MSITDFISAAIEEKPVAAQKAFADAIQDKVDAALSQKYDEVATNLMNGSSQELETEMEDSDYE